MLDFKNEIKEGTPMRYHKPPVAYVGQVNLKVENLERSIQFYQEVIGFSVLEQTDRKAYLTADGKTALLTIEQPENAIRSKNRTTGLYHFALLLPTRADLARIVKHFAEINVRLGASDHLVSEALYLSDPDGNGIEIYADRDPNHWRWIDDEVDMATIPLNFQDLLKEESNEPWDKLPAETVMGHIHLQVAELDKNRQFYIEGLGFEVVNDFRGQALFIADHKYHHHIAMNTWAGVGIPNPAENHVGLDSFTIVYPNQDRRDQVIEQLRDIGATIEEEADTVITIDPSGNRILLDIHHA